MLTAYGLIKSSNKRVVYTSQSYKNINMSEEKPIIASKHTQKNQPCRTKEITKSWIDTNKHETKMYKRSMKQSGMYSESYTKYFSSHLK